MRRYIGYALLLIALLTLVVWAVSQFIQPILPSDINSGLVLFFVALIAVIGVLAGFKDIIELFHLLGKKSDYAETIPSGLGERESPQDEIQASEWPRTHKSGYFYVVSKLSSDKCLDVSGGCIADKTKIQLFQFHGSDNQQWKLESKEKGYFHIVSKLSQGGPKCLDVPGGQIADGTPIELYSLHGGENQQWKLVSAGNEFFHIVSRLSRLSAKCLDVPRGDTADETQVELYSFHGGDNQQWQLIAAGE